MDQYKKKRQEEMGMLLPQDDLEAVPQAQEEINPFEKPAKGKKVEKGKKEKKDKKKKKKRKGNDDDLVEAPGAYDPDMEKPKKSKKSKTKGKYDID